MVFRFIGTGLAVAGAVLTVAGLVSQWTRPGASPLALLAGAGLGVAGLPFLYVRGKRRAAFWAVPATAAAVLGYAGWRLYASVAPPLTRWFERTPLLSKGDFLVLGRLIVLGPAAMAAVFVFAVAARAWEKVNDPARLPEPVEKEPLDVEVCRIATGPVVLKHRDRYLHTLVVGTTGTGKTSRVLKPMVWQDLLAIKEGRKLGITVIEPKGDFAQDVADMCRYLNIPVVHINPEDPATPRFNPMQGKAETVAEIMRTVLRSLFGRQEAFFRLNQELAARNTALLVKQIKGENATMLDMANVLRSESLLTRYVDILEQSRGERDEPSAFIQYFRSEVLGQMKEKSFQFVAGLRLQLDDIIGNAMMRRVLVGKSDIDLDRHLEEGGVLVVGTAMGALGKLGDAFGQFVMMHFQEAVFRRPGNEWTRTPHVLYIDEFPRYVNPDFERMLAIGRSFRCGTVLAVQTTAQIELEEKRAFKDIVLEACRNKVILNLGAEADARQFAKECGELEIVERQKSFHRDATILFPLRWDGVKEQEKFKPRFPYTFLMEMPKFKAVVKIMRDGEPRRPVLGDLTLSPFDRRKARRKRESIEGRLDVELPAAERNGLEIDYGVEQPAAAGRSFIEEEAGEEGGQAHG